MQSNSGLGYAKMVATIAIVMLALTGCSPTEAPTAGPNPTETTQPTADPTETPVQTEFFSMPADCTG
ncbi:MAG: hypothetical protein JHC62_07065, partial [Microbacteriaceae bacterium]|nr:hypothetical protein [Microbacteriaceae bacterium]